MENSLPGGKEASYRLLGLEAIAYDGGVILKRGTTRVFLDGDDIAGLVDVIVEQLAGGRVVELSRLQLDVGPQRREALTALIDTLKQHRFLVSADGAPRGGDRPEDVFCWNYQTSFAEIVGELAEIPLTVFGVNSIGLALLGNLRGCGFRDITFVDHPALRNFDYYDAQRNLRHEISGALSVPPLPFDEWTAADQRPGECFVVCCDFGGRPLMRDWNRYCVDNRVLFYPIVLRDHVVHLGPLVRPGDGPCYECLWARQNANLADAALVRAGEAEADSGHHAVGYLQPMARVAADFAAIDLLKTFSRSLAGLRVGSLIEVDLLAPRLTTHHLLKVPDCPVCSRVPAVAEAPETDDTGTASPEDTANGDAAEEAAATPAADDAPATGSGGSEAAAETAAVDPAAREAHEDPSRQAATEDAS